MNEQLTRRKFKRAAVVLLVATILVGGLIVDNVGAAVFFYVNSMRLQTAADQAAVAGANFLPANPKEALKVARSYARMNGIRASEIVEAEISPNRHMITIEVERRLPIYLTGVGVGISKRRVQATGSARTTNSQRAIASWIAA